MPREHLFSVPADQLKYGVTKGNKIAHIIGERNPKDGGVEIDFDNNNNVESNQDLTQEQVYRNDAEKKNKTFFMSLASKAAEEYEKDYADDGLKNCMLALKDYVTSPTRAGQQNTIRRFSYVMTDYNDSLDKKQKALEKKKSQMDLEAYNNEVNAITKRRESIKEFAAIFQRQMYGNLKLDEETKKKIKSEKITEPSSIRWFFDGGGGQWHSTTDVLFPHDPTPNDIKQGVGLMDCFMLSGLTQIAEKYPEKIKEAMCDNDDGTVTVRFFDHNNGKKPVFITVNKTVNKTLAGHNFYASSSLWVQIYEKAYAKFVNTVVKSASNKNIDEVRDGFTAIDRGQSSEFLNSFFEDKEFTSHYMQMRTGISNSMKENILYRENMHTLPKYYLPEEKELFDIYSEAINKEGSVMTVGIDMPMGQTKDFYKEKGLRPGHAYTVREFIRKTDAEGNEKLYVRLRDPYASFKTGYKEDKGLENRSEVLGGFFQGGTDTMGTFDIEFRDFEAIFSSVSGIEKNLYKKIQRCEWRNYDREPLSPEEIADESKLRQDAPKEVGNLFGSSGFANALDADEEIDRTNWKDISSQPIKDMLDNPEKLAEISKNFIKTATDLKSTDEWFVWTNTKYFNDMRDKLYELNGILAKLSKEQQKNPEYKLDEAVKEKICEKFEDLQEYTQRYIGSKSIQIGDNAKKGKTPSVRALHRITAAMNIEALTNLDPPVTEWKGKTKEQIRMVLGDVKERMTLIENNEKIPHDDLRLRTIKEQYNQTPEKSVELLFRNKQYDSMERVVESIGKLIEEQQQVPEANEDDGWDIKEWDVDALKNQLKDGKKQIGKQIEQAKEFDGFEILEKPEEKVAENLQLQ